MCEKHETYFVFAINAVTTANSTSGTRPVVPPTGASLSIRTIASHVACITTDSANDAGRVVLLLRAIIFTMANLTTVLAGLVFIVSQSTVQRSELSELVTLELVLVFGRRSSLLLVSKCESL